MKWNKGQLDTWKSEHTITLDQFADSCLAGVRNSYEAGTLVAVLGIGISMAHFDRTEGKKAEIDPGWTTFLKQLHHALKQLPATNTPAGMCKVLNILRTVIDADDSPAASLLSVAYYLRSEIVAAPNSNQDWEKLVHEFFLKLEGCFKANPAWKHLLSELTQNANVLTTNYDWMANRSAEASILAHVSHAPGVGLQNSTEWDQAIWLGINPAQKRPTHLGRVERSYDFYGARRAGLLTGADERFIHHVHGIGSDPNSLVLDAGDYASGKGMNGDRQMTEALWAGRSTLFLGAGGGILDPHWTRILDSAAQRRGSKLAYRTPLARALDQQNFWFLIDETLLASSSPGSKTTTSPEDKVKELLNAYGETRVANPLLSIVRYSSHDSLPTVLTALTTRRA